MPRTPKPKPNAVSPNNPCPFLRALVAQGHLADAGQPIGEVVSTIVEVARAGDGAPKLAAPAIGAIALMANGMGPLQLAQNALGGVRLNQLRNGPLDKKGVGSGILDALGQVNTTELDRLDEFASEHSDAEGRTERGLDLAGLKRMMDANFERAAGKRRRIDRKLMDGEWPILLKVMGKDGTHGRYLSVEDVRTLFTQRRLPQRMSKRLNEPTQKARAA